MKKVCLIFAFALAIFSFVAIPKIVLFAEPVASDYRIEFTVNDTAVQNVDSNLTSNYFSSDYTKNEQLLFTASIYDLENQKINSFVNVAWVNLSSPENVLSNTYNLNLLKNTTDSSAQKIYVGETIYKFTVYQNSAEVVSAELYVNIVDDTNGQLISITSNLQTLTNSTNKIKNTTSNITFNANIFMLEDPSSPMHIDWYIKTPNSSTYKVFVSNVAQCTFSPKNHITEENGYGVYKIYAMAQNANYAIYSEVITFEAIAEPNPSNTSNCRISSTVVQNTKANLQAFKFSITNFEEANLDPDRIYWIVNQQVVGNGSCIIYEPTTNESFSIYAEYQVTEEGARNIILASIPSIQPQSTQLLTMILVVVASVAVIGIISAIVTKRLNKKRDVVW